jgi:hypothetical protein
MTTGISGSPFPKMVDGTPTIAYTAVSGELRRASANNPLLPTSFTHSTVDFFGHSTGLAPSLLALQDYNYFSDIFVAYGFIDSNFTQHIRVCTTLPNADE